MATHLGNSAAFFFPLYVPAPCDGFHAVCRQLRMQQARGTRDRGPSAHALPEVRAARPVQNASVALLLQGCFEVGLQASLTFTGCMRPQLEGSAWAAAKKSCHAPDGWSVCLSKKDSSFHSRLRIINLKLLQTTIRHACRAGPPGRALWPVALPAWRPHPHTKCAQMLG